jgi:multimeric flavodoxin WrbA
MKSIVCIMGSPRADGNSSVLANSFCSAAEKSGAIIKKYQLSELNYQGCKNLFACKTVSDRCGQTDDLTEVLEAIRESDIVLLSSPIYFTDVTGQLKMCLDRWFSFFVPDYATSNEKSRLKSGKVMVLIQTQGEGEDRYTDILDKYNHSFQWLGFSEAHFIQACGIREVGDINNHPEIIRQASELGRKLAS